MSSYISLKNYIKPILENYEHTPSQVIMTTYFNSKNDWQRHIKWPSNDFSKIKMWYDSLHKIPDLFGIIFVDSSANQKFIKQYTSKQVKFVKVPNCHENLGLNEYRFEVYLDYLNKHTEIKDVFMTDGNDVKIVQNPFKAPEYNDKFLFIGNGRGNIQNDRWGCSPDRNNICVHKKTKGKKILNCGCVGGCRKLVLELLSEICNIYKKLGKKAINFNLGILNEAAYNSDHLADKIKTGAPIVSRFFKYENHRKDVWFIHK